MISGYRISIYFPVRNEAQNISRLVSLVPSEIDEIIIVDNCSTDNIELEILKLSKARNLRLIKDPREENGIGYGYAHQSGIRCSSGDIIVTADADMSYPIERSTELVEYFIQQNLDFLVCRRTVLSGPFIVTQLRRSGIFYLSFLLRVLLGINLSDPLSGMWIGKGDYLRAFNFKSGGWNFSLEVKITSFRNAQSKHGEIEIVENPRGGFSKQRYIKTIIEHSAWVVSYWWFTHISKRNKLSESEITESITANE